MHSSILSPDSASGAVLVIGSQAYDANAGINNGTLPAVAVTGATVNSAAIIGSMALTESIIEGAEFGSFGGPWGAVAGATGGAIVGTALEAGLSPQMTGQYAVDQFNNFYWSLPTTSFE